MSFTGLPHLNTGDIQEKTADHNAPLPSDSAVLENRVVNNRDINDWEGNEKASDNGPKQKAVVVDSVEDTEWPLKLLPIEIEERTAEMLDFPSGDQDKETQDGEDSGACSENGVASIVVSGVTIGSKVTTTHTVDNYRECGQAKTSTELVMC